MELRQAERATVDVALGPDRRWHVSTVGRRDHGLLRLSTSTIVFT
jgi:hypothetical protein